MEKVLKIKSNLDKLNSQALDDWNGLEDNIFDILTDQFLQYDDRNGTFCKLVGRKIMAIFKAYLDSEKDIV